jgi:hypothetical protein
MSETHEVISAFLDDEPFSPKDLGDALSDPAGRALLIDLIALRHLTQSDGTTARPGARTWTASLRTVLAVAAVLVALVGGYFAGTWRTGVEVSAAPAPNRIVQVQAEWRTGPSGGAQ